jgi:hypothetical protein
MTDFQSRLHRRDGYAKLFMVFLVHIMATGVWESHEHEHVFFFPFDFPQQLVDLSRVIYIYAGKQMEHLKQRLTC